MFFFLPFVFGCPTRIKQEGDPTARVCPKCRNASVVRVKSRMWFELCFVPLIPMRKEHLWLCTICQWSVPLQQQWEPPFGAWNHSNGQQTPIDSLSHNAGAHGYQPHYMNAQNSKPN